MLRQILSPNAESEELAFNAGCHVLQQQQQQHQQQSQSLFNTHGSVLTSALQVPPAGLAHHQQQQLVSVQEQQHQISYHDQVQIITETHICPNCGLKLTYHVRTAHHHQVDQMLDVGETQLMRFTCHICSKTFLAQSHVKLPGEPQQQQQQQQQQHQQQQQMMQVSSRIQTNMISTSNQTVHYQTSPQHQQQQQSQPQQLSQQGSGGAQDKSFSCERCQAIFRYRTHLEKHKKVHELSASQDKPYSCPRCLMRFETRNLYNHHAKTHKPMITTQSTERSPQNTALGGAGKEAVLYNKSNNSYPCETCAKEFPSIESLTSHKAVHRSRPLICDVCGKGFTHRKYYVVHQRIHTGERPYLCAMCGKSFTQASTLTVHRRYHTGERPYTCTLCGKGFVTRTIMLNHMKKH